MKLSREKRRRGRREEKRRRKVVMLLLCCGSREEVRLRVEERSEAESLGHGVELFQTTVRSSSNRYLVWSIRTYQRRYYIHV